MGKGRLAYFPQKCTANILLSKGYFPFCTIGYNKLANEGIIRFSKKFGAISPFLQKYGKEAKNPIMGY